MAIAALLLLQISFIMIDLIKISSTMPCMKNPMTNRNMIRKLNLLFVILYNAKKIKDNRYNPTTNPIPNPIPFKMRTYFLFEEKPNLLRSPSYNLLFMIISKYNIIG